MVDLTVNIGSLKLKNPVLTASGTFGYGTEYSEFMNPSELGGIITKTITLEPREGNPVPRIAETPAGMINSIGLANVGSAKFLLEKLPALETLDSAVVVNIAGSTVEEYGKVAELVQGHKRVDAIEVNVSCPNVDRGGIALGVSAEGTFEVTKRVRQTTDKPIIVKLTPNVTDITQIAEAAEEAGADAVSLINTLVGMVIDIESAKPLIARGTGGLSGPAIKPIAVAKVYQVAQVVNIPIIGLGGIMNWRDAVEFIMAGASAVQVGTLNFVDPRASLSIVKGINDFCREKGIMKIEDLCGIANKK
ncbi:dihydroorotate dehydrogenase [bacterium]|nr:dihydroorotate dehydrogenase [bacterium]